MVCDMKKLLMAVLALAGALYGGQQHGFGFEACIQQGGVFVSDEKITSLEAALDAAALEGDGVIVKKGKKTYHKFVK